jgi:RNA polymerase sigma factor (sigma-70 family)
MKSGIAMRPAPADDSAELVGRMRRGDASAWREVVDRYEPLLRRFACRNGLSADDADDAVQLTWLRCVGHLGQLTQADRLRAWLISICRRESVHLAIRARRELQLSEPEAALLINDGTAEGDPCGEVVRRDEHHRLNGAIAALPLRQREVLVEVFNREGESYAELSHRLGLPVGSIGPTCQRAVIRLRNDPRLAEIPDRHLRARSA